VNRKAAIKAVIATAALFSAIAIPIVGLLTNRDLWTTIIGGGVIVGAVCLFSFVIGSSFYLQFDQPKHKNDGSDEE
jgi:multisubunit Na+/H+ antiporter MnhC subunit